jgi:lipopolysaccharide export system protein LptA
MSVPRVSGGFRRGIAWTPLLALALLTCPVRGQVGSDCDVPRHNGFVTLSLSNGSRITYFSQPTIVCSGNTRISADSAVVYEATNYTQLFRHVVFEDGENRLTADQAHYFDQERRLRAWGYVILNDLAEGSIIRGDTMVLLRAGPNRPEDQLTVTGRRPHATLYPTRQPAPEVLPSEEAPEGVETPQDTAGAVVTDTMAAPGREPELPDTAEVALPDTAEVVPPDTAEVVPPDTAEVVLPDTAEVVLPDTAEVVLPDTAEVVLVDSAEVILEDTALAAPQTEREAETTSEPPPEERVPYEILAQRMVLEGSRYFRATGGVVVNRDSVNATADSLEYDETVGALELASRANLTTSAYDLSANTIRLDIPQDEIRGVLAREEALLEGENLWLLAPTISLVMEEGRVQRLIAVQAPPEDSLEALPEDSVPPTPAGRRTPPPEVREKGIGEFPARPHAVAQDFLLWADSIEVLVPDEVLEEVLAMGAARGESLARDSLNTPETPPLVRRDWLEGDTIVAIFVPNADTTETSGEEGPAPDEVLPPSAGGGVAGETQADSAAYRLDHLVAKVRARSLYRLAPTDSTAAVEDGRLAIHYVTGDEITIYMTEGEVDRMEVAGATQGIHMEPVAGRRRTIPPDTTVTLPGGRGGRRR